MENTLENKARFFAQYLNQHIVKWHKRNSHTPAYLHFSLLDKKNINSEYLELTPLSQISDEDAIEVAKLSKLPDLGQGFIVSRDMEAVFVTNAKNPENYLKGFRYINEMSYQPCVDFIRSKGYAIPWMGLSVEKLIEYGWVKLKEVK